MMGRDDLKRSYRYAELALDHLRRNALPATPRNFEFWYIYASGFNGSLKRAVDTALRENGRIDSDTLKRLCALHLSPAQLGDQIGEVGGKVVAKIGQIGALIETALDEAASYSATLQLTGRALSADTGDDNIRAVLSELVAATAQIDGKRRLLEAQLSDSRTQLDTLQAHIEAIHYESLNDQLTTLGNRKHFDHAIERAVDEAATERAPLSLLLTDIDHFKSFNDRYGHPTGDHVLRLVALAAKQNITAGDTACRYGGEEFAIILPRTDSARALAVGEHIRQAVMHQEFVKRSTGERLGRITISIGVATHRPGDTIQSLIERADACLYAAKHSGRNRVVLDIPAVLAQYGRH
ncbi:GGDEF domain-containing protein [Kaistia dalseonensis]|uniref:diguanylate cyclase n=1 Tax=Kaistia dalseonensis TaxID=410840 RepID=A0ABU0H1C3_9HYPH|nr:GGDEF domain-containing protein [Kaistia dalseonensis]MCX5493554.1 GGDEF domain-containing protein [Kaistia dalseonensis]MDQ0436114.1 diguanylate cyclase [Kaistia dalseonensis]